MGRRRSAPKRAQWVFLMEFNDWTWIDGLTFTVLGIGLMITSVLKLMNHSNNPSQLVFDFSEMIVGLTCLSSLADCQRQIGRV
jgi:hypothetical protein